jgi:glycosyltransferase involved in cell wall biosynthesis
VHAGSEVLQYQCRTGNGGLWFRTYPEFEGQLNLLLDRPDIRDRLGANGRAYVQRDYAWAAVERRLFAALDGTE